MDRNQRQVELFKAYSVEEIEERREMFSSLYGYWDLSQSWSSSGD